MRTQIYGFLLGVLVVAVTDAMLVVWVNSDGFVNGGDVMAIWGWSGLAIAMAGYVAGFKLKARESTSLLGGWMLRGLTWVFLAEGVLLFVALSQYESE